MSSEALVEDQNARESLTKSTDEERDETDPRDEVITNDGGDRPNQQHVNKTLLATSDGASEGLTCRTEQQIQPSGDGSNKMKRTFCPRCKRPAPKACICESLPNEPILLRRTRILVLQHPHETKRKNRSVPLLELTLSTDSLLVGIGRRLGDGVSPERIMDIIRDDSEPLFLLYPGPDAIPLQEAMKRIDGSADKSSSTIGNAGNGEVKKIINILVLDGTWKYAREMDLKNKQENQYPDRMIRIQLKPTTDDKMPNDTFQPGRFDIRTPPSPDHLSTAECIAWIASRVAWIASRVEQPHQDSSVLLDTLLKPLDCMVSKWKYFQSDKRPAEDDSSSQRQSKQRKHVEIA
jgi:DTW domain-containing protein YfiP